MGDRYLRKLLVVGATALVFDVFGPSLQCRYASCSDRGLNDEVSQTDQVD
jgi:hypothetical protein